MNLPIEQLIEALNALTAATERNSAIAQNALDLHLSAASHLPTGIERSVMGPVNSTDPLNQNVDPALQAECDKKIEGFNSAAPAKKTRAKKADTPPPDVTRDEALAAHTEVVVLPVEETPVTPEPEAPTAETVDAFVEKAVDSYENAMTAAAAVVTVETIRAYIGQYMLPVTNVIGEALEAAQANNAAITAKVKEINAEFGATRIPDVPTERLAEYLTVIKRWIPLNK